MAFVEFTPSGGLFQFSVQLAGGMAAVGDDVAFFTGPDPELGAQHPGQQMHPVLPTWHPADTEPIGNVARKVRRGLRAGQLVVAWLKLLWLLARLRPDVVIWSSWRFSMDAAGVLAVRRLLPKAALALVAHEPVPRVRADTTKDRRGRVLDPALTKAWNCLDAVFVLGEAAKAKAIERWGITCPVVVVPHGDEAALRGADPLPDVVDTDPVVLFFGAWTAYKGIDLLFDAVPAVKDRVPDAQFVVAGSVLGVDGPGLAARAAALGVDARPGYVATEDIHGMFAAARVVVTPYRRATQSGVVHLAYTFERPVVATAVGDIPSVVQDGVTGFLVTPDDPAALADGLVALLADPALAQKMGAAGAAWLAEVASWPAIGRTVHETLEQVMADPTDDDRPFVLTGSGPGLRNTAVTTAVRAAFAVINRTVKRGHYAACRLLGSLASPAAYVEFSAPGGGRFRAHPRDGYWMRIMLARRRYEPELLPVVTRAVEAGVPFLDCGANLGWWSVIAGAGLRDPQRVLAVEASPSTYRGLTENARLNGNSFATRQVAVWSRSGEVIDFVEARESAASSVAQTRMPGTAEGHVAHVPTATLDELLATVAPGSGAVLCKLDVEGAEIEVLSASERIRSGDVALMFEDHGSDLTSAVSMWLIERGFVVHCPDPGGALIRMTDLASINALKVDPEWGYNFLAWIAGGAAEKVFGP